MGRSNYINCESCPIGFQKYFSRFDKADQKHLNEQKIVTLYKKGETIYREKSSSLGVYCLREGKVKVFRNGLDGREHITRLVLPGEYFGLKTMLSGQDHSVTTVAMEDSIVCFVNKCDFLQLMAKYPGFTRSLINVFSQVLENTEKRMISMAYKPVRERLAEALLFLFESFYFCQDDSDNKYLNLTRMDLANIIGTAQETVIRLLSEMKQEKIIQVNGRKIFLKNPELLKSIAIGENS